MSLVLWRSVSISSYVNVAEYVSVVVGVVPEMHMSRIFFWMLLLCVGREGMRWWHGRSFCTSSGHQGQKNDDDSWRN